MQRDLEFIIIGVIWVYILENMKLMNLNLENEKIYFNGL